MKRQLLLILAAFTATVSCMKEQHSVQEMAEGCFTARFSDASRTTLKGLDVVWEAGDEISINGWRYRTAEGGLDATFTPIEGKVPMADRYVAVYPSSLALSGDRISGTLQSGQKAREGVFPAGTGHAVAVAKESSLEFRSMFSYLSLKINAPGVASVSVKSNGGEPLCGPYSASFEDGYPLVKADGDGSEVILSAGEGKETFSSGCEYLLTVFPSLMSSGFTVTFNFDAEYGGGSWSRSTDKSVRLGRAVILDLGAFNYDFASSSGSLEMESDAAVSVDLGNSLSDEVSPLLFGSFSEMHSGDLVPGILEQYILNPSLEMWYRDAEQEKSDIVFPDTPSISGVAYPWQVLKSGGAPSFSQNSDSFNSELSQKISVSTGESASLLQKLALPTYREMSYKLKFYAKRSGSTALSVCFTDAGTTVKSEEMKVLGLSGEWQCFEHEFTLSAPSSFRYNRYGIYNIRFDVSGEGEVLIDEVTLYPSDCVEGIFNPETLAYFKEYKVASIRWPGGNFTSTYHWKDGIGAPEKRPTRPNYAWNGVDANLLGTDEFMRFCTLAGCTPVMGVGYGQTTVEEVAGWVEYCNGSTSTAMGALRAANGHPEPYNVKYWGFGNEVYYHYDVTPYASALAAASSAMKVADPSIQVIASGYGVHNTYRNPASGWTSTLQSVAGDSFDIIDTHCYVYGPPAASDTQSFTAPELFRIFSAANVYLRGFIDSWRTVGGGKGMAFTEFGVLPKSSDRNTPRRQAFSNLLCSACEYNEMIRQSDIMKLVNAHNFSFYVNPQSNHSEPVNARTELIREYASMAGGHAVSVDDSEIPTYRVKDNFLDIGLIDKVPELDVAAVVKGKTLWLSVVNRNASDEYCMAVRLRGGTASSSEGKVFTCSGPYAVRTWTSDYGVVPTVAPAKFVVTGGSAPKLLVPPLSFSMLRISLD